jgi:hypothetical protein
MTKRNSKREFSRKKLFANAVRITNSKGERVWKLDNKEYKSKQEMYNLAIQESKKTKEVSDKPLTKTQ